MNSCHPQIRPTVHDAIRIVGIAIRQEQFCISEDGCSWTDNSMSSWHSVTDLIARELGVGGAEARWLYSELVRDVSAGSFEGRHGLSLAGDKGSPERDFANPFGVPAGARDWPKSQNIPIEITPHGASAHAPDSETAVRQFTTGEERLENQF